MEGGDAEAPREGRRATKAELAGWRAELGAWSRPGDFAEVLDQMRVQHDDHLIDQAGSPFREAFIADVCARMWSADAVRLGADPPDFELVFSGRIEQYECVEVQAPGRRRGDELKADRLKPAAERAAVVHVPQEDWIPAADALAEVAARAAAKAAMPYPAGMNLIVYLNVPWVVDRTKFQRGLAGALSPARRTFGRVWLLDNGQLTEASE